MEIENLVVFGGFFTIRLNSANIAICKTCGNKRFHSNNLREIAVHYLVLVV